MLVLTRRINEAIVMDGDIHITVLSVEKGKVRLGISAPLTVGVHREEILKGKVSRTASRQLVGAIPAQ